MQDIKNKNKNEEYWLFIRKKRMFCKYLTLINAKKHMN